MRNKLEQLDHFIRTRRPDYYPSLNPTLHQLQLLTLQDKYKLVLPEDLVALYQWKNVQQSGVFDAFVNNSQFVPLAEALDTNAELTGMIGLDFEVDNWWNKNWIPLFHNGGGDYICYDLEGTFTGNPGQLIEFWHADADRNVIAPSLSAFIDQLINLYQTTENKQLDEFVSVEALPGYPISHYVE